MEKKLQKNLIDIQKDIITHPTDDLSYIESLFSRVEFSEAEMKDIQEAFGIIIGNESLSQNQKVDLLANSWKVNFRDKPPSIEEFLTPMWLGETAESLFSYIKQGLIDYFNPNSIYRNLIMSYPIGSGKSFLAILINLYIATNYYFMRNPKKFLNVSESSYIVNVLVSFSMEKAYELLCKPMFNIIGSTDKFHRCKTEQQLIREMQEYGTSKICYTTAGEGSVLRIGNLNFKHISSSSNLLGLSILCATASELTFFRERGFSDDYIFQLYSDMRERVKSRFPGNYFARTILDSSPNDVTNRIDRYIWKEAKDDPTNMIMTGSKWELQPWLFPVWEKDKTKVFPVYKGSSAKPPKILSVIEVDQYQPEEIIYPPIDVKQEFINNCITMMKNYAGLPAGGDDKLIQNPDLIEGMFTPAFKNIYGYIHAPANLPPEGLLWPKVRDQFFTRLNGNRYEFYRYPNAQRFISIDLAEKHDMATISCCHNEWKIDGTKMYIIDFSIAILATKEKINLDSFPYFIHDLIKYGGLSIRAVSFDQFQSSPARQYLERNNIQVERLSVDIHLEYYLSMIGYMNQGRIISGRNLILKNNLKSLIMERTEKGKQKVGHIEAEWQDLNNEDWMKSLMGYGGKDLSDSVCACITLSDLYGDKQMSFIYNPEIQEKGIGYVTKEAIKEQIFNTTGEKIRPYNPEKLKAMRPTEFGN
jgi:hypothetical protein